LRLKQHELALRERMRKRDAGRSASGTDIDDRSLFAVNELEPAQRVVEQRAPRLLDVCNRRQPRSRNDAREPALKWG
jgi:hypothetical protein